MTVVLRDIRSLMNSFYSRDKRFHFLYFKYKIFFGNISTLLLLLSIAINCSYNGIENKQFNTLCFYSKIEYIYKSMLFYRSYLN